MLKRIIGALFALFVFVVPAFAADRFWVGGTGTWDAVNTTNWSATSGGAGGASVPGSGDVAIFDEASGGGTVTVNTTVNIQQITMGAFTGTLDFATNDNNVNLSVAFSGTGTGTRTLNMGDGTWTISGTTGNVWNMTTVTNLTFNANNSTIVLAATSTAGRTFVGGGLTYRNVTVSEAATIGAIFTISGSNTFNALSLVAPLNLNFANGTTTTINTPFAWTGTAANPINVNSASANGVNVTVDGTGANTMAFAAIRSITFVTTGGVTYNATNSFDLRGNTGITITPPGSGGNSVIGGGL